MTAGSIITRTAIDRRERERMYYYFYYYYYSSSFYWYSSYSLGHHANAQPRPIQAPATTT